MGCNDSKEASVESSWAKSKAHDLEIEAASKSYGGNRSIVEALQDINLDDAEQERAATKIQATYRGHQTRKQLQAQRDGLVSSDAGQQLDVHDPELAAAATRIQASFRGHQVRKKGVLHQKEEDFYREMEMLHTQRPNS